MLKSELLKVLTEKLPNIPADQIEPAVNCLLKQIENALIQGEHVEVRGFGSFDLHYHAPRKGRNPKTGESVELPTRVSIHFNPGKELRQRVNSKNYQHAREDQ